MMVISATLLRRTVAGIRVVREGSPIRKFTLEGEINILWPQQVPIFQLPLSTYRVHVGQEKIQQDVCCPGPQGPGGCFTWVPQPNYLSVLTYIRLHSLARESRKGFQDWGWFDAQRRVLSAACTAMLEDVKARGSRLDRTLMGSGRCSAIREDTAVL
jgi:hypothetical protein